MGLHRIFCWVGLAGLVLTGCKQEGATPQGIRIVGSSTAAPFMVEVADRLAMMDPATAPVVEVTGTGAGLSLLCAPRKNTDQMVLTTASRPITQAEEARCLRHTGAGVQAYVLGLDGLVLLTPRSSRRGKVPTRLTPQELFKALAAAVPDPQHPLQEPPVMVPNPYTTWQSINPKLPKVPIVIYGPPANSGLQEALLHLVLKPFCQDKACWHVRTDAHYIEMPENSTLMLEKIRQDRHAMGLSSFRLFDQNRRRFKAIPMDGVAPSANTLRQGRYPLARELYLYIPQTLVTHPLVQRFLATMKREELQGRGGVFEDLGLVVKG